MRSDFDSPTGLLDAVRLTIAVFRVLDFQVFGASSGYNIGYILAEAYKSDGSRERPYETVEPLAQDLGLTVDTSWLVAHTWSSHLPSTEFFP